MLLPDGFRFSPHTTARDWTDDTLAKIRQFYSQFTDSGGSSTVNLQGIVLDTNGGGRLPVDKYLAATLIERDAVASGRKSIAAAAQEHQLNAKYLGLLWNALNESKASPVLDELRAKWRQSKPEDGPKLAAYVAEWQKLLWKFSSVGQIGRKDGPKRWMESTSPKVSELVAKLKLTDSPKTEQAVQASLDEFRKLFPPALCYAKIVPVDEVISVT